MIRPIRKTLIRCIEEPSYAGGPGLASVLDTDAIEVINPQHDILRTEVPREIWFPHLGASEHLIAAKVARIRFSVEITGSGDVANPPPWARLLRGCGFAQSALPGRIEWNPISDNVSSLFFDYVRAGARYTSRGARGTVKFRLPAFGIPTMDFEFTGFETFAAEASPGNSGYDLSAYRTPVVLTDANSGDLRLGATRTGGSITGGTAVASRGLEVDIGNQVEHYEYLTGERVGIARREVTGKMSVVLTAAQEITWRNEINANTNTSLAFNWGTVAGDRWTIWAPKVQRVSPQAEDYKGDLLIATDLRFQPTPFGNNEFVLVMR